MAAIIYDVLDAPSWFDRGHQFHGVGSLYLREAPVGGRVYCYMKPTSWNCRLPLSHEMPIVMICAGTGLAPMRAFVQERAAIAEVQQASFGNGILYFGCRDPDKDYICRSELETWERIGVVDLRLTFSRAAIQYKYVPDRLWTGRGS